jgi:hypothetical protein
VKKIAVEHYTARQGNCAQSIASAWQAKRDPESQHVTTFASEGSGRAPDGVCGALYAAEKLAGSAGETIFKQFKQATDGHVTCRDIRRSKVMPCAECVALAAGLLEEVER